MDVTESFPLDVACSSPIPPNMSDLDISMDDGESIDNSEVSEALFNSATPLSCDNDFDVELPQCPSPSPALPAKSIHMPASLLSRVPSADTATIIHMTPTSRPSPIASVPAAPATFTPQGVTYKPSNDPTKDRYPGIPQISTYDIYSPEANLCSESSSPVSIALAFDPMKAPLPETNEEIRSEIRRTRMMIDLMEKEMVRVRAQTRAVNVRTGITKQALVEAKAKLAREQQECKNRRSVRTSTRCVTPRMLREQRAAEQEEMTRVAREGPDAEA